MNIQSSRTQLDFGKLAPGFELQSSDGQTFTRGQFRGRSGLVLVFFEPTPDADKLLVQLNKDKAEYREINARVFGIAPLRPQELAAIEKRLELYFYLLSDPKREAWKSYSGSAEPGYGVYVLDTYGGVDNQRTGSSIDEIPNAEKILEWARGAMYKCSI